MERRRFSNTIAFVSGKGGAGKTTSVIAIASLLSRSGIRTLVIDFDLVTNGASYFFADKLEQSGKNGIVEELRSSHRDRPDPSKSGEASETKWERDVLTVNEGFYFLASRSHFATKTDLAELQEIYDAALALENILKTLAQSFDYVLIDCQAGSTVSAQASVSLASRVAVVSEADAISSDAVDNLLVQLGEYFPSFRRYLINKLDIREVDQYKLVKDLFGSMNRLPPLPFDFAVRNAFGSRRIPFDIDNPSPFVFALLDVARELLPTAEEDLKKFGDEVIEARFVKYEKELDSYLSLQSSLQQQLREMDSSTGEMDALESALRWTALVLVGIGAGVAIYGYFAPFLTGTLGFLISGLTIALTGYGTLIYSFNRRRKVLRRKTKLDKRTEIARQTEDLDKKIETYRSFLLARSRELLITQETPHSSSSD